MLSRKKISFLSIIQHKWFCKRNNSKRQKIKRIIWKYIWLISPKTVNYKKFGSFLLWKLQSTKYQKKRLGNNQNSRTETRFNSSLFSLSSSFLSPVPHSFSSFSFFFLLFTFSSSPLLPHTSSLLFFLILLLFFSLYLLFASPNLVA